MRLVTLLALIGAVHSLADAEPRTSATYSITTEVDDAGGQPSASALYSNEGSAGGVGSISSVSSPFETNKGGYIGQLFEVTTVQLGASSSTMNVGTTLQLNATATLDDGTTTALIATQVNWSVQSGPIASISSSGLATAGTVYQNTAAVAQGSYFGSTGTWGITVVNTAFNAWQVEYFGGNTLQAAPSYVSDGSGLTNLFKYIAGLVPLDSASTFVVSTSPVSGQPGQMSITINPALADRSYTVQYSTDLINWFTLTGPFTGNGSTETVTDTNASGPQKFYRVEISYP